MSCLLAIVAALTLLVPMPAFATDATAPGHSTVHIVFVVPFDNAGQGMGQLDENGKPVPMATAGSIIVPYDSIRPVSIKIDGEFVGHALFGYDKVSPVFILPSGKRKFTLTCDGFKDVTQELQVLGTGSTQYLIVKMTAGDSDMAATVSPDKTQK